MDTITLLENTQGKLLSILNDSAKLDIFSGENKFSGHLDAEVEKIKASSGTSSPSKIISDLNQQFNKVLANISRENLLLLNGQILALLSERIGTEDTATHGDDEEVNLAIELSLLDKNYELMQKMLEELKENEKVFQQLIEQFSQYSQHAINTERISSWAALSQQNALLDMQHLSNEIEIQYQYLIQQDKIIEALIGIPEVSENEKLELSKQQELIRNKLKQLEGKFQLYKDIKIKCLAENRPLDIKNYSNNLHLLQNLRQELQESADHNEEKIKHIAEKSPTINKEFQKLKQIKNEQLKLIKLEFEEKKSFLKEEMKEFESTQQDIATAVHNTGKMIQGILGACNDCLTSIPLGQKNELLKLGHKLQNTYANQIEDSGSAIEAQLVLAQCANEINSYLQSAGTNALGNDSPLKPIILELASIEQKIQSSLLPVHLNVMNDAPAHREKPKKQTPKPIRPIEENITQQQHIRAQLKALKEGKVTKASPNRPAPPPLPTEQVDEVIDEKAPTPVKMIEIDSNNDIDIHNEVMGLLDILEQVSAAPELASNTGLLSEIAQIKEDLGKDLDDSKVNISALTNLEAKVTEAISTHSSSAIILNIKEHLETTNELINDFEPPSSPTPR